MKPSQKARNFTGHYNRLILKQEMGAVDDRKPGMRIGTRLAAGFFTDSSPAGRGSKEGA
jgi:hypothetical protein